MRVVGVRFSLGALHRKKTGALRCSCFFGFKDAQNDIITLLDTTGAIVVKYNYDAWGKCVVLTFGSWSRNLFKDMSKEFFKTVVVDTTSRSAIVYSALISSSISGWY